LETQSPSICASVDPAFETLFPAIIGALVWAGLYLRDRLPAGGSRARPGAPRRALEEDPAALTGGRPRARAPGCRFPLPSFDARMETGETGSEPHNPGGTAMRYITLYKPGVETTTPPPQDVQVKMGQLIQELAQSGELIATDGLQHSSKGAKVRLTNGKFTVTDGPFAETKELIAGYAIFEVASRERIMELTRRFLSIMGQGESEVRLMPDQPAYQRA
jgi:hypothetical protein